MKIRKPPFVDEKQLMETTAENLRILRQNVGYRQEDIARLLGLTRSSYTYYETAKTPISSIILVALSKLYKITPSDILGVDFSADFPKCYHSSPSRSEYIYELGFDERMVVGYYRLCNQEGKELVMAHVRKCLAEHGLNPARIFQTEEETACKE